MKKEDSGIYKPHLLSTFAAFMKLGTYVIISPAAELERWRHHDDAQQWLAGAVH
ncbi:predicted protein [Pyrenophora tritici-repentis Pt-1C-BFP]|uniref:Uncharacterized protein n=1 Tax=Pyrenophora tritici-repentis (strain Pt-1C-BFP) TaxID=426418 RepID=B2W5L1_PYRTR|nr:uncharacterized protein PTRG_04911 [Pyrenophora tritici-repentis Pt-1C-BFP]EDU47818.1 predicted protein [Pyrenophora tritici-repentis Pt-1C-BFP]